MRCKYCRQDFHDGSTVHPICRVWSCRFLRHIDDLTSRKGLQDVAKPFFVTAAHRESYRDCGQQFFRSYQSFVEHLFTSHGGQDSWQHSDYSNLERNYSQLKRSVFEPSPVAIESGSSTLFEINPGPVAHIPTAIPNYVTRPLPEVPPTPSLHPPAPTPAVQVTSSPPLTSTSAHRRVDRDAPPRLSDDKTSSRWRSFTDVKRNSRRSDDIRLSRLSSAPLDQDKISSGPRFYIGFRSFFSEFPTLYYFKDGKDNALLRDESPKNGVHLSEIQRGFVASLALSSALVGMASEGIQCRTHKDDDTGWVEFGVDEDHLAWASRPSE